MSPPPSSHSSTSYTPSTTSPKPFLRLPHPYLTSYALVRDVHRPSHLQLRELSANEWKPPASETSGDGGRCLAQLPEPFHRPDLWLSEPVEPRSADQPPESNNSPWGRARRAPGSTFVWGGGVSDVGGGNNNDDDDNGKGGGSDGNRPSLAQLWLLVYALLTLRPEVAVVRVSLDGPGRDEVARLLRRTLLAIPHPPPPQEPTSSRDFGSDSPTDAAAAALTAVTVPATPSVANHPHGDELLILRAAFWQGAGSPFGCVPPWMPSSPSCSPARTPHPLIYSYPSGTTPSHPPRRHPLRPPKPAPGQVVYSRYIPHLSEQLSMVCVDATDPSHLGLFHAWQNDPRVSAGWDAAGDLETHRRQLSALAATPHVLPLLACFDGVPFAYFEAYYAVEDGLGGYYASGGAGREHDRGRRSLVGDVRYRGPARAGAWWGSLVHYLFLDDPRTVNVVGEPKASNGVVLSYDFAVGFGVEAVVDLDDKRSALMRLGRERFFQGFSGGLVDATVGSSVGEKVVLGTSVRVLPKL